MIIYGSRMYGRQDQVTGWGVCDNCNKYGKHVSYFGRKWGHLYFIPIIPAGGHVRVIKECKRCSNGFHIPREGVPGLIRGIKNSINEAVKHLEQGKKSFIDPENEKETDCISHIANSIEFIYCLGDKKYDQVIEVLKEKNLHCAYHVATGAKHELHGRSDDAIEAYRDALEVDNSPVPLAFLGAVAMLKKDWDLALESYELAAEMEPESPFPLFPLIDIYENQKDWLKLSTTYERCFELVPDAARDKALYKGYKKACKKAGKQPVC